MRTDNISAHGHHGRSERERLVDREHARRRQRASDWDEPSNADFRLSGRGRSGGGRHRHGFLEGLDGPGRGGRNGLGRGGGGRFFGPGDLRALLLWLIAEKPRHGYELIKAAEQLVGGAYSPSPGSVYPILSLLEDIGQIEASSSAGPKKLFQITDQGRQVLQQQRAAIEGLLSRMKIMARTMGGMRPPEEIFQAFQTLKTALALHRSAWTEDEVLRVSGILKSAIAEIQADHAGEVPA
jgi:DNA-binding PadR family transcriptional regulator